MIVLISVPNYIDAIVAITSPDKKHGYCMDYLGFNLLCLLIFAVEFIWALYFFISQNRRVYIKKQKQVEAHSLKLHAIAWLFFGVSESSHLWLNLRDFSLKPNNQLGRSARYW